MAIATINPTTGATEKTFAAHDAQEIERRVAAAASAHRELAATTFAQRADWIRAAADLLGEDADALARTMTLEMGKPIAQSRAEIEKCQAALRFYAENAESFLAPEELEDPSVASGASRAGARYQSLGAILAVMPWNFPLWQVIRFAAPALMAGNVGLLKHASNVPQTALYLDDLFARAGFPRGAFQTLLVGSDAIEDLIADERIAAVTLTGSEGAGKAVAAAAAGQIKKSVLELGGSDPFIIMPSADLDKAVETAVTARVQNNGQSCIAAKRFIVHADVYDAFTEKFVAALAELTVGDPLDDGTDVGPIALQSGLEELEELVEDAKARGASVLLGGDRGAVADAGEGWFYPVTVLADIPEEARIVQEETFGPVAALYRAEDREDALRIANQTEFGLSSSVWTADEEEIEFFADGIEAGGVFVNGMTASTPHLPFGGIKRSGYGRELAAAGIREFCNLKTVWVA